MTGNRPMGASPRILVVDDNDDNLYTLKLHLDLEGYTNIETARDGEEAIARLKASAFERNPPTLPPAWAQFSSGIYRLDGRLLVVLDIAKLLALGETS